MPAAGDPGEQAREEELKTELSDDGMAMDPDEIPHTADADPDEEITFAPGEHEE